MIREDAAWELKAQMGRAILNAISANGNNPLRVEQYVADSMVAFTIGTDGIATPDGFDDYLSFHGPVPLQMLTFTELGWALDTINNPE